MGDKKGTANKVIARFIKKKPSRIRRVDRWKIPQVEVTKQPAAAAAPFPTTIAAAAATAAGTDNPRNTHHPLAQPADGHTGRVRPNPLT